MIWLGLSLILKEVITTFFLSFLNTNFLKIYSWQDRQTKDTLTLAEFEALYVIRSSRVIDLDRVFPT